MPRGIDVVDRGDLAGPKNPWRGPVDGYRHLDEVVAWNRAVLVASSAELRAGRMPVMLGGDHCLAIGSIAAVANHCRDAGRKLRILWLDAHTDFNTHAITPSGNVHGMPVACLCGIGPSALTELGGVVPAIEPAQIRQIGIRSVDRRKRLVHDMDSASTTCATSTKSARHRQTGADGLDDDTHCVSFVSTCSILIAPGTGTRTRRLNYREAQLVMEMIADTGRLGSLEVEVNPALDRATPPELAVDRSRACSASHVDAGLTVPT